MNNDSQQQDTSGTRYESVKLCREARLEAERALSMDGVWWYEATLPARFHRCYAHASGVVKAHRVERCACGSIRIDGGPLLEKNSRRKGAVNAGWFNRG